MPSNPADSAPIRRSRLAPLLEPIEAFLFAQSAGGLILMASALVALIWANSPWRDAYHHFWHTEISIGAGKCALTMSLQHWVNEGLMAVFFLLVGLEIKRELLIGELASMRRAALPFAAAIGGMIVPALIYAALNARGPGAPGWGIPMATDIAFAVGILTLVGRSAPTSVKVLLLAIAIVDDLGAVLVIAFFYTSHISWAALGVAGLFFAVMILLNILNVHRPLPYMLLGIGLWAATLFSGIDAAIAGVLVAFIIPATRQIEELPYVEYVRKMLKLFDCEARVTPDRITNDQSHALKAMEEASQAVQTPLARVEHALLNPVNLLIVPLFALANAGVTIPGGGASAKSAITWGVLLGLSIGKPAGILLAAWATIKSGLGSWPDGARIGHIVGVSVLCGIGFTMSLFVANLAFDGEEAHLAVTKIGILVASIVSGVTGAVIIARAAKKQ